METAEALEAWSFDIAHQPLTLYGEGYGPGIQKDGGLYRADKGFILFDVLRGGRFLERQLVEEIAVDLDIPIVPHVMSGSIAVAIEYLTTSPLSIVADSEEKVMEGLVGIPKVPLYNQWGERVIVKLKVEDHNKQNRIGYTELDGALLKYFPHPERQAVSVRGTPSGGK